MAEKLGMHEECHMRGQCTKYDICPMILVQGIVSGKWKILILWYLSYSSLRFSDLKKKLPDVTQKMLTQQLRSLEKDKLIYRQIYPVVPPKVEYGLTETGKEIIPILEMMHHFGANYLSNKLNKGSLSQ
ncbi:MAG: helix-turn-helix transcriptional regulator [Ruminiclostridium sp.]|nr:helix-turn-helix transcriptional regulator [Ruminiclostridium sp.]